jgi:hypothetical protein
VKVVITAPQEARTKTPLCECDGTVTKNLESVFHEGIIQGASFLLAALERVRCVRSNAKTGISAHKVYRDNGEGSLIQGAHASGSDIQGINLAGSQPKFLRAGWVIATKPSSLFLVLNVHVNGDAERVVHLEGYFGGVRVTGKGQTVDDIIDV